MIRFVRPAVFTLAPLALTAALLGCAATPPAPKAAPTGEIKGTAWAHTPQSLAASVQNANVVLPAQATGGAAYSGKWSAMPASAKGKVPVVLFLHGSSGLGLKAIGEWQQWLAAQGIASVAPDSFALPDHVTYKSPIDKASYERIHALRASEIAPALAAIQTAPWADTSKLVLAGTSEGAVPVARYADREFAARMLFAWSCEPNYFVTEPRNAFEADKPVQHGLGNPAARGSCADALKDHKQAMIALVPGAPHTLLTLPQVQAVTGGFLGSVLKRWPLPVRSGGSLQNQ